MLRNLVPSFLLVQPEISARVINIVIDQIVIVNMVYFINDTRVQSQLSLFCF